MSVMRPASLAPPTPELGAVCVRGTTRAEFLVRATLAATAVYGTAVTGPFAARALARAGGDLAIVNYALTLEHLEAAFYTRAVQGVAGLSGDVRKLAVELRDNEIDHVDALTATVRQLDGTPAKKPGVDFGAALATEATFLKLANTFEDLGVSAYNGVAPAIEAPELLGAFGAIVQVEARHAALIRLARTKPPAPLSFDKPSSVAAVRQALTPFIAP